MESAIIRTCPVCGSPLGYWQNKYCSVQCCGYAKRKSPKKEVPKKIPKRKEKLVYCDYAKICLVCGIPLSHLKTKSKYCSRKCLGISRWKDPRGTQKELNKQNPKQWTGYMIIKKNKDKIIDILDKNKANIMFQCKNCGIESRKIYYNQEFCHRECYQEYKESIK